ncbi:hypothetical protein Scep_028059 [Stephania cephalantha]|uniref:Uncharacterized protein n=1 Tax=Stephania cephalantha TaxID=152367 RepID=A0AAP0HLE9_9MAGN
MMAEMGVRPWWPNRVEGGDGRGVSPAIDSTWVGVDTGDQLATKDPVDLDSGTDYGVLKCVVRSTPATEMDQVIASWVRPLVGSWKGIPKGVPWDFTYWTRHPFSSVMIECRSQYK